MKLDLNLKLGNGYLYGDATTTESISYKINIQQGWPDTTLIVPSDLNQNPGQKSISFYTESGNQILRGNVKNEDTDMIRLFTNLDTLVQLTKRLPTAMDIQDLEAVARQIKVQDDTYDELVKLGKKNETFDTIIKNCIKSYKKEHRLS
jgi:osmotically-inducible protein OsmY